MSTQDEIQDGIQEEVIPAVAEEQEKRLDTKKLPAIIMLLGGSVACIVTFINHYDLKSMLMVVALSLIVFLVIGLIVQAVFSSFRLPVNERVDDEGEVVEKEVISSDEDEGNDEEMEAGELY